MGYFSNNRQTDESLAASNEESLLQKSKIEIKIYVEFYEMAGGLSTITFTEDVTGFRHVLRSVNKSSDMGENCFLAYSGVDDAILKTATSLRDCLLTDDYFNDNFDIEIVPYENPNLNLRFDFYALVITSKAKGKKYDCSVSTELINNCIAYEIAVQKSGDNLFYKGVKVDKPREISLVNNPNFITFSNINSDIETQPARMTIDITSSGRANWIKNELKITITEKETKIGHPFLGVYYEKDLTDNRFLIDTSVGGEVATIYNLRECMMHDTFIRNNFEIIVHLEKIDDHLYTGGKSLELVSKGYGTQYDCSIETNYGEIPQDIIKIDNIELEIKPDYFNITEGDDTILSISYTERPMNSNPVTTRPAPFVYFTGKLSQDQVTKIRDFLIVKPQENVYTEEPAREATLKNLQSVMSKNQYIGSMFDIDIIDNKILLLQYKEDTIYVPHQIAVPELLFNDVVIPKVTIPPYRETVNRYVIKTSHQDSVGIDSVDDGKGNYKIELDIYTDTGIKWGEDASNVASAGTYLTTLSKSYFGKPLWFELNTLMSKRSTYSPLFLSAFDEPDAVWVDPGTMSDYHFVTRRTGNSSTEPIYISDMLYTINGYDYTLNDSHLGYQDTEVDNYILDLSQNFESNNFDSKVKPLTTNLERTHIEGQKQYFNCIVKKRAESEEPLQVALLYKLYTQSGKLIDAVTSLQMNAKDMSVMNTTELRLDQFLPRYNSKTVGRIDVCLISFINNNPTKKYVEVSDNMSYRILPSGLHTVHDFAFLNRLGGWESMNFGGSTSNEFKVTSSTIFKTLQPSFKTYNEIESVSSKSIEEKLTVQSSPINRNVVEWLREMVTSTAVYELSTRRYVLVDDMTLKYNKQDDLFQVDLKYHYSDVFNGRMK